MTMQNKSKISQRKTPPFRADHVGSLVRPLELRGAHAAFKKGALTVLELEEIENQAIIDVIKMQERVGLLSITDGEFRRDNWRDRFFESVEGYTEQQFDSPFSFTSFSGEQVKGYPIPHVRSKLKRLKSLCVDEFSFLAKNVSKTAKVTLPSPITNHFYLGDEGIRAAYDDRSEYLDDIGAIYKKEVQDLAAAGCTYLQLDEVCLALSCDPKIVEIVRRRGDDISELMGQYVGLVNSVVDSRPSGMTICMHLCRGNIGHGFASGGYEPIAEQLFNEMHVDGYFLEYDTERAGTFEPLKWMPVNKFAVLGMVSTKTKTLENIDTLKRRVADASRFIDCDRICLSPQCGFASTFSAVPFTQEDEERKLAHLVQAAYEIWK